MADLTEAQAAGTVKLIGSGATGAESNFAEVSSNGAILVSPDPTGPSVDGFGGLRTSAVMILGAYNFAASPHSLSFQSAVANGGTFSHVPMNSCVRLGVTTASGSSSIYQTKRYYRYSPGEGHKFTVACPLGAPKTNVTKRVGMFDTMDGLFLEQTGTDVAFVIRTSSSGSPVNTRIVQADWNVDKFDGTGPSGITINFANHNIFLCDYSWHGAGRIRFGFFVNGRIYYAHNGAGGNLTPLPWSRSPLFPLRFEIVNTGVTASATNLEIVATHIAKESTDPVFVPNAFSRSSFRTAKTAGSTLVPVISIRPALTFNGITNRVPLVARTSQILGNGAATLCQVVLNPTLTNSNFASVGTFSAAEFDTSATAISGGTVIFEFYCQNNGEENASLEDVLDQITLGLNIAGNAADILTIAAVSTGNNASVFGTLSWQEFQ